MAAMADDQSSRKPDETKRLILARRARFVAAALASVAVTAGTEACGGGTEPVPNAEDGGSSGSSGSTGNPQPCLKMNTSSSGEPQPCLSPPAPDDAGSPPPQPCLSIALDSGNPQPCLSMPAPDAGGGDK